MAKPPISPHPRDAFDNLCGVLTMQLHYIVKGKQLASDGHKAHLSPFTALIFRISGLCCTASEVARVTTRPPSSPKLRNGDCKRHTSAYIGVHGKWRAQRCKCFRALSNSFSRSRLCAGIARVAPIELEVEMRVYTAHN